MWSDSDNLATLTKVATWAAAVLGLLAGGAGVLAVLAGNRADTLREELKKTPPRVEVALAFFRDKKLHVVIDSLTKVPFEHQWVIATKNDILVTGFPLEWTKTYPSKAPQRFNQLVEPLHPEKIIESYVELRFEYRSLHAAELGLSDLSGTIIRKYRIDLPTLKIEAL
jgi:hypothetical protein